MLKQNTPQKNVGFFFGGFFCVNFLLLTSSERFCCILVTAEQSYVYTHRFWRLGSLRCCQSLPGGRGASCGGLWERTLACYLSDCIKTQVKTLGFKAFFVKSQFLLKSLYSDLKKMAALLFFVFGN